MLKVQKTIQNIFLISREFAKVCSILFNPLNQTSNSKWNKIVCQYLHVFSFGNDLELKLDCPFQVVLEMSLADGLKHCYFCYTVQENPLKVLCTLSA